MAWPWRFVDLDDKAVLARRQVLDRYAGYAQISAFGPVFVVLVYRLALWVVRFFEAKRGAYSAIPVSPSRKLRRQSQLGAWEARYRQLQWWLGTEVVFLGQSWGRNDEWVFGLAWGAWMLLLTVLETGPDYLHLTKRAGAIALSQLPLQYLLALKSLNPIAFVLRSSHEDVNRFHRALGRIIYGLLVVHAILYLNFFVQKGLLMQKLTSSRAVITGIIGIWSFTLLSATTLKAIRTFSYRVFFITHLAVALIIPPLIWFHAHTARTFLTEALAVFLVDIIARKIDTITSSAALESISGTNLVKVTAPIPPEKVGRFQRNPGSHIYMQIPAGSRPVQSPTAKENLVHEFLFNPFTVAGVDEESGELTLVARHRRGPMTTALRQIANGKAQADLTIEGPYGVATHLSTLSSGEYDRVLLVSGGVGATFTVPLYRALVTSSPSAKVQLVWSVRTPGDAAWAQDGKDGRIFSEDEGVQIYVTGTTAAAAADADASQQAEDSQGGVELAPINNDNGHLPEVKHLRRRPDLKKIVDDVFRHGQDENVAVLFCGPDGMGRDLRRHVAVWVKRGRVVFWHSESFGW